MPEYESKMVAIFKTELVWVVILFLAILAAYKIGVITEKIGELEDVVFRHGLYKKVEQEAIDE